MTHRIQGRSAKRGGANPVMARKSYIYVQSFHSGRSQTMIRKVP